MKNMKRTAWEGFVLVALLLLPVSGLGAPYGEEGETTWFSQPNGSVLELRIFGDEFYAVTETTGGYVLVFDPATKAYYYALLSANGDELVSSGVMVREGDNPKALGFKKHIRINKASRRNKAKRNFEQYDKVVKQTEAWKKKKAQTRARRLKKKQAANKDSAQPSAVENTEGAAAGEEPPPEFAPPETTGGKVGITILVDFPDDTADIDAAEIDDYFNEPGYSGYSNNGSIFDYFYTQSARKLRYNNVITYYVRMQQPKSYYDDTALSSGTCGRRLLEDALDILTAEGFDFSACTDNGSGLIEACNLLFAGDDSGVWAKGLWPHRWVLSPSYDVGGGLRIYDYQMTDISTTLRIGTVCHENGHMLCKYPDFYDYDGDSSGCGKYTLMASGNHYYQTSPISVGAYLRYHSGWVDVSQLTSSMNERCSVRVDEGRIYMYDNPDASWPGEYFLLENRAKIGWESSSGLPDQGLLIMHCDEYGDRDAQDMTEALHYECSIEQADNAFDLENDSDSGDSYDLFHSGGAGPSTTFSDSSSPNAHWWKNATSVTTSGDNSGLDIHTISASGETMTFIIGAGTPSGTREIGLDQSSIYMETDHGTDAAPVSFAVWNKQGGTLSYTIATNAAWLGVSSASGTASTESDAIDISFNSAGLSAGTYNGTITVSDSGAANSPQTIAVQLVVFDQPSIGVNSNSFFVSEYSGNVAETQLLKLSNAGGGTMDYSLSKNSAWLSLSSTGGTIVQEEDRVYLGFDASALIPGTYYDTVTVVSASADNSPYAIGIEFEVFDGAIISASPSNITLQADAGATDSTALVVSNTGDIDLTFSITDSFPPAGGYDWVDSDDVEGPVYNWIDISALGSSVTLTDDAESAMLNIGFDFLFYGSMYSQFQIAANGSISFTSGQLSPSNTGLPSSNAPSQSLMPFWDDLNPSAGGTIRYHGTAERLVVSWLGVPRYSTSDYETFQVILYPDGRIVYQYNNLNGLLTSATVGLQDDNSTGPYAQVAYNESYLKNGLAVEIAPSEDPWLSYPVDSGTISGGASTSVWFTGSASNLSVGVYTALVTIVCNDLTNPELYFPVTFTVSIPDTDHDGIPDWWETQYYGGATNANTNAICANGINTVLEAYIAEFDPTNSLAGFAITGFSDDAGSLGHHILQWDEATGRVYTVYWASNLMSGFSTLQTNYFGDTFTDTVHEAYSEGFYRIEVEIAP